MFGREHQSDGNLGPLEVNLLQLQVRATGVAGHLGGIHGRLQPIRSSSSSHRHKKLQKMKANKAKRDSAETTSTKDYIVQGAKEDIRSMDVETNKTDNNEYLLRDDAQSTPRSSMSTF